MCGKESLEGHTVEQAVLDSVREKSRWLGTPWIRLEDSAWGPRGCARPTPARRSALVPEGSRLGSALGPHRRPASHRRRPQEGPPVTS